MANTPLYIPSLEERKKFTDYRQGVWGNSFSWYRERAWTEIKYLVIHHTVTNPTNNPKSDVDYIAEIHRKNGWLGVGYHLIIDATGVVWYVGDLSTQRANVANMNDKVVGIALIGDFTKTNPTDEQIISAHDLCKWFIEDFKAVPDFSKGWEILKGHSELQSTACPGTNWKGVSDSIYERIKNRIPYTPQPQPEPVIDWQKRYSELSDKYNNDLGVWNGKENGYISTQLALETQMADNKVECQGKIAELELKLANAESQNPQIPKLSDFPDNEILAEAFRIIINKFKFKKEY